MSRSTISTWNLYLEKTAAQRRLMAGVQTVFENANMSEWVEKLHACKTVSAVNKLMAAFETANMNTKS